MLYHHKAYPDEWRIDVAFNGGPSYSLRTLLFAYTHVYSAPNKKICAE
jgi:hypothetical protein